ncbi:MAG: SPOR domain-containing protein [Bacteroidota bacterium]
MKLFFFFFVYLQISFGQINDSLRPSNYPTKIKWNKTEIKNDLNNLTTDTSKSSTIENNIKSTRGFRIQIFASNEYEQVQLTKSQFENIYNGAVYVIFDEPIYKIRVGNFQNKKEATVELEKIKYLGFANAWIVPDNIILK